MVTYKCETGTENGCSFLVQPKAWLYEALRAYPKKDFCLSFGGCFFVDPKGPPGIVFSSPPGGGVIKT